MHVLNIHINVCAYIMKHIIVKNIFPKCQVMHKESTASRIFKLRYILPSLSKNNVFYIKIIRSITMRITYI